VDVAKVLADAEARRAQARREEEQRVAERRREEEEAYRLIDEAANKEQELPDLDELFRCVSPLCPLARLMCQ
jgi:hypothetical protein